MRPPVKLAFTSLLTSKLLGFNFVIHFTPTMCYTLKAVSVHSLTPLLSTLYDYSMTADFENIFSNTHSYDEYSCQVSLKSLKIGRYRITRNKC